MTKYTIFDTETTGLPPRYINYKNPNWFNDKNFPYIVQFSWIHYDDETDNIIDIGDYIIKLPENINIPKVASDIHLITNEISKTKGIDIKDVLIKFNKCLENTDVLVAHNLEFDKKLFIAEIKRNNIINPYDIYHFDEYCTMENTKKLCNIVKTNKLGLKYLKYPKLVELHEKLFNKTPNNLHNSLIDVIVCTRCFIKLKMNKDLYEISKSFYDLYNKLC